MTEKKPSRRASRVWYRLAQTYGARLADSFGKQPPPDWCDVVDRNDPAAIEHAIVSVRQKYPHHPPSLGEFIAEIPRRDELQRDVVDELACAVVDRFLLCAHQRAATWHYYGRIEERIGSRGGFERVPVVRGVVVPPCRCEEGGNAGYRLRVSDLR